MSHRILKSCVAFALLAVLSAPLMAGDSAGDLWFEKKSSTVEFVNGGEVVGLQFDINVGKIDERAYNCGGNLPEQFIASCFLNGEVLRVVVHSMDNFVIPDSTLLSFNVNNRSLSASASRSSGKKGIHGVVLSDANGRNITPKHLE